MYVPKELKTKYYHRKYKNRKVNRIQTLVFRTNFMYSFAKLSSLNFNSRKKFNYIRGIKYIKFEKHLPNSNFVYYL